MRDYSKVPAELKVRVQWVVASDDKIPRQTNSKPASVADPSTWTTFEAAVAAGYPHIGYVFSKDDPYCGVDLDAPLNEEQTERHRKIFSFLPSYAEASQSGKGAHIFVKASVPFGVRRDRIELYSEGRYFIVTGKVIVDLPITDHQGVITTLHQEMSSSAGRAVELEELPQLVDDAALMKMASTAKNSEKFNRLYRGDITGYSSQSEADYALLDMLAFYSSSNEQVRRLFRDSALGSRDKATRDDIYIDRSLGKLRSKRLPLVDISGLLASTGAPPEPPPAPPPAPPMLFPPGLIGEMADYVFSSAIRQVPEVGLAAAIALGAGIAGRHYNTSATGLNQYLILLAATGAGKEGAAGGIDSLITAIRGQVPMADDFIGPGTFASGQALTRAIDKCNSFVSIMGEIGLTLQQICDKRAGSHQIQLRKVLLDLFAKSGWNKTLRPSVYSDVEKNTGLVRAPCVSILGESTPGRFYDVLDAEHVAEGLLSRFLVLEYLGLRPPENPNPFQPPGPQLVARLVSLCQKVVAMRHNETCYNVQTDTWGQKIMGEFNAFADDKINNGDNELVKQLWNRAHLKALKLAGLVAVGCAPDAPVVTKEIADWSIALVQRDVGTMVSKFDKGDIGQGDHRCESEVRSAVVKYEAMTEKQRSKYNVSRLLHDKGRVVPFAFLKQFLGMRATFRNDRRGAVVALDVALKDMVRAGILSQIPPEQAMKELGVAGVVYYRGESW